MKLRRRRRKTNWKGGSHADRSHIPDRVDISERPDIVEAKARISNREVGTIAGKAHSGGAIVSSVDRATKYTLLRLVDKKTAEVLGSTMFRLLGSGKIPIHTLTAINGKAFADHICLAKALDAQFYFARPYHSRERGLNGYAKGLAREWFPKGTEFRKVSDEDAQTVQVRLNAHPTKVLGYLIPEEVMFGLEVKPL